MGAAASWADDDDVELVLGPALGVGDHRRSDACRRPPIVSGAAWREAKVRARSSKWGPRDVGGRTPRRAAGDRQVVLTVEPHNGGVCR